MRNKLITILLVLSIIIGQISFIESLAMENKNTNSKVSKIYDEADDKIEDSGDGDAGDPMLASAKITDENFQRVINKILGKSPDNIVTRGQMASIRVIESDDENIESIQGIQFCTNLEYLSISKSKIKDISYIKNLKNLKIVNFYNNCISDISTLSLVENLEEAYIENQKVETTDYNKTNNSISLENNVVGFGKNIINPICISDNGNYSNNMITWNIDNLNKEYLSYKFKETIDDQSRLVKFSGEIIADIDLKVGSAKNIYKNFDKYNQVGIYWSPATRAKGYEIYRSETKNGEYTLIETLEGNKTSYIDNNIEPKWIYYYKVKPYSYRGSTKIYGEESDVLKVVCKPKEVNLSVESTSYNSNTLSWNKIDGVSGYEIYTALSQYGPYSLLKDVGKSTLSTKDTSLLTNKTYYYKVRPYRIDNNERIYGEFSEVVSSRPDLDSTKAKASSNGYNSIKVSWSKVDGASGYKIYRSTSKNGKYYLKETITKGSILSYTNTKLTTGKTYYYKVKPYRIVNNEKVYNYYCPEVSAKPILSKPSVTLSSKVTKKVNIKWNKISGASGYELYRSTNKKGSYSKIKTITKGSTTSYVNSNLSSKKGYYYKVKAYRIVNNKKVYSSYSSVKYVKTK